MQEELGTSPDSAHASWCDIWEWEGKALVLWAHGLIADGGALPQGNERRIVLSQQEEFVLEAPHLEHADFRSGRPLFIGSGLSLVSRLTY